MIQCEYGSAVIAGMAPVVLAELETIIEALHEEMDGDIIRKAVEDGLKPEEEREKEFTALKATTDELIKSMDVLMKDIEKRIKELES